jgi:hypothetical protein
MECGKWQEAFKTAEAHSDLLKMVHAQHAAHLVQHDRFEDAMQVLGSATSGIRRKLSPFAGSPGVRSVRGHIAHAGAAPRVRGA